MLIDLKMEELLSKYFSGEASPEDTKKVLEWRSASEENARVFFETRSAWLASGPPAEADADLLQAILEEPPQQEAQVIPLWNQKLFRVAVAALIVLGGVLIVLKQMKPDPYGQVMTEVTEFDLPDGSDVTLQRGASIQLVDFENERAVELSGKAFFEVKRDESKPFRVLTSGASVEVLGTSFVVNTNEETGATEVMVASGEVALRQKPEAFQGKSMRVLLREGETGKLVVGERGIQKKKNSDENYLAWKTKILTFNRTNLREVSVKLSDVYGIALEFEDPTLSKCNLTAKFSNKNPEEVVDIIARTFSMTYHRSGDKYLLSGSGCR